MQLIKSECLLNAKCCFVYCRKNSLFNRNVNRNTPTFGIRTLNSHVIAVLLVVDLTNDETRRGDVDDWDDVWEQWDDEDCCCGSVEDSESFEFELEEEKEESSLIKIQTRPSSISRDILTGSSKDDKRPRKIYSF